MPATKMSPVGEDVRLEARDTPSTLPARKQSALPADVDHDGRLDHAIRPECRVDRAVGVEADRASPPPDHGHDLPVGLDGHIVDVIPAGDGVAAGNVAVPSDPNVVSSWPSAL